MNTVQISGREYEYQMEHRNTTLNDVINNVQSVFPGYEVVSEQDFTRMIFHIKHRFDRTIIPACINTIYQITELKVPYYISVNDELERVNIIFPVKIRFGDCRKIIERINPELRKYFDEEFYSQLFYRFPYHCLRDNEYKVMKSHMKRRYECVSRCPSSMIAQFILHNIDGLEEYKRSKIPNNFVALLHLAVYILLI